jgi:transcriptional regulator
MYVPKHFAFDDPAEIHAFLRDFPFATLVTTRNGEPFATHLPLVLDTTGPEPLLRGHVARANQHWQALEASEADTLAIFHGPHAYVSPRWYRSAPAVPTWNYVAVHVYGRPRLLSSHEELLADMAALVEVFEPDGQARDVITPEFVEKLSAGIVGFRMPIARIEGKRKLSQNRALEDRQGVADALAASSEPEAMAYTAYLARRNPLP